MKNKERKISVRATQWEVGFETFPFYILAPDVLLLEVSEYERGMNSRVGGSGVS